MLYCQLAIAVSETSQVGEVRRRVQRVAEEAGFDETVCGRAAIVATELATNLSRYAHQGEMLVRSFDIGGTSGIELLSIDRGPGLPDVPLSMGDGHSTGGTAGEGFGAIQRLSTEFDIFSAQPGGTVVFSRIQASAPPSRTVHPFAWGAVNRPAPNEQVSGDCWRIAQQGDQLSLLIADGLGHGPLAAEAAETAAAAFDEQPFQLQTEYFACANRRMRGTRGAVIGVAHVDAGRQSMRYAGVGNIAGSLRAPDMEPKGLMSHNGTVGGEMRKVVSLDFAFPDRALLIMHSDGLQTRWTLPPGLAARHPAVVAGVLYRDFRRSHDDVTIAVVRVAFSRP